MWLLSMLTAAIAPGIALLAYFYLKDRYDAEPIHMVARMFVVGALIVLPIAVIQRGVTLGLGDSPLVQAFLVSAGIEEAIKWFVLYHMIYNHTEFDEPYDGIVYAAAVSLGFATVENVLYALLMPATFGSLILRALLPVSGHALFGVVMGYYIGKAKFASGQSGKYLAASFLLPLFWHGAFDYILLVFRNYWMLPIAPFMAYLWIRGGRKIRRANDRSPFRSIPREDEIKMQRIRP
ncbi:MAG: peptidase [Thermobacillus sp. ZCTH02-B1]|uniref:glutamic-type intramembrane protease PrsW n=1 Tax=Thermobacillus sp. ZCTH02-B1 TaxID=1858795 RepID=UPI000B561D02|nr:glutamic-type intramembrane protease PrsW [Thermobacillus sp. ZCTH02-B1]OUM97028.1 MAG: peptidase [Thermobacillus sp. ZCTH02-B1]